MIVDNMLTALIYQLLLDHLAFHDVELAIDDAMSSEVTKGYELPNAHLAALAETLAMRMGLDE